MTLCAKYNTPSNEALTRPKKQLECLEGKKTRLLGLSKNKISQQPYTTILPVRNHTPAQNQMLNDSDNNPNQQQQGQTLPALYNR